MRTMTSKEISRLSRAELLELLVAQSQEMDRLRADMDAVNQKMAEREEEFSRIERIANTSVAVYDLLKRYQAALDKVLGIEPEAETPPEVEAPSETEAPPEPEVQPPAGESPEQDQTEQKQETPDSAENTDAE